MNESNGAWVFNVTNGTAEVNASHKLEFDLDDGETVVFNADQAAAIDTNTITRVTVKGVFTPVKFSDLPTDAEMNSRGAQVGFVVSSETVSETTTYKYYAWVGGSGGSASGTWIALGSAIAEENLANEATIRIDFDYRRSLLASPANYVTFNTVVSETATPLANGIDLLLTSTAGAAAHSVAGMTCYGSGTLASADGAVQIGVAKVEGVKYGSLADAVTAASSASVKTIDVLRATNEDVELADGITIEDANGLATGTMTVPSGSTVTVETKTEDYAGGASGPYSILLKTSGAGTINVTLTGDIANYKEIASAVPSASSINVTLQTKTSVLEAMRPDAANGSKGLAVTEDLRTFLNNHCNTAYTQAASTTSAIEDALKITGSNGLKVWQDYVLGITPSTELKPVNAPAGDSAPGYIKLALPEIDTDKYSGDYSVSYTAGGVSSDDPSDIQVPLSTGTKTVKVVLTPNNP